MLAELQRAFARELLRGEPRLAVHRETTLAAIAAALESTYPVCARLVGPDFFRALARRFARERPSRSPDLNDCGAELAEYLAGFPPARELVYLPDVVRLEWALHRARHAAPPAELELARWRGATHFRAAAGTTFLGSPFPIDRIWQQNQDGYAGPATIALDLGAAALAVAREPDGARFTGVTGAELELYAALARGESLEQASSSWRGSAERLGAALARAVERRWLV